MKKSVFADLKITKKSEKLFVVLKPAKAMDHGYGLGDKLRSVEAMF
jgi:hypothetical protein